jgi:hypothetical protein
MGDIAETTKYVGGNINLYVKVIFAIYVHKLYIKGQIYGINSNYKKQTIQTVQKHLKTSIDY